MPSRSSLTLLVDIKGGVAMSVGESVSLREFSEALSAVIRCLESHTNSPVTAARLLERKLATEPDNAAITRPITVLEWLACQGKNGLPLVINSLPFWMENIKDYEKELAGRP